MHLPSPHGCGPHFTVTYLLTTLLPLLTYTQSALAVRSLLTMNGISSLQGYPGLAYQAVRYEPICGNLGKDARFLTPIDMASYCGPAIDSFANNTKDNVALYDTTGSRLKNARVGGGTDVCMCFALGQTGGGIKGALCIWVSGTGQVDGWWSLHLDGIVAGNYRPNVEKGLPLCADVDVSSLREQWSATAFQPEVTESWVTLGAPDTKTVVSTYIPSVVNRTEVLTVTTTDANGSPTVQTSTRTSEVAVVTVEPTPKKGLSTSDKIALGVGLGVGIPTILLMTLGLCLQCRKHR